MTRQRIAARSFLMLSCISLLSGSAQAGIYSDDLARCLVRSTTEADKKMLLKWIFAAMASHPDVKALASVSPSAAEKLNRETGQIFSRILTQPCKSEARQVIKLEGTVAFEASFSVLGEISVRGLVNHPKVEEYISALDFDTEALAALLAED